MLQPAATAGPAPPACSSTCLSVSTDCPVLRSISSYQPRSVWPGCRLCATSYPPSTCRSTAPHICRRLCNASRHSGNSPSTTDTSAYSPCSSCGSAPCHDSPSGSRCAYPPRQPPPTGYTSQCPRHCAYASASSTVLAVFRNACLSAPSGCGIRPSRPASSYPVSCSTRHAVAVLSRSWDIALLPSNNL